MSLAKLIGALDVIVGLFLGAIVSLISVVGGALIPSDEATGITGPAVRRSRYHGSADLLMGCSRYPYLADRGGALQRLWRRSWAGWRSRCRESRNAGGRALLFCN